MKALSKSLRILNEFCLAQTELGVSEIATALGMNRSIVSKTLKTFRDAGFLRQDATSRKYMPDIRCFLMGSAYINQNRLGQLGGSIIRRLADETGHSAMICCMFDGQVMELAVMEGREFFDTRLQRGTLMPSHATATGQVLLALTETATSDDPVADVKLTSITPHTIVDREEFTRRLQSVRERGFSVTRGESLSGLGALAVPIFDESNTTVAALCLAFLDNSVPHEDESRLIGIMHASARRLSMLLGAKVYPW